jgi:hypothetical protein
MNMSIVIGKSQNGALSSACGAEGIAAPEDSPARWRQALCQPSAQNPP